MQIQTGGFNRLDFDEAKQIAEMVNFDVMQYAKKLRSCGPGCDYFSKDKKYFITMLLKHIGYSMEHGESRQSLPSKVHAWYAKAKTAHQEHQEIEKRHMRIRLGKGKS
jgi:hypothetical protein